jgi:2-isopropylmalate synthase
MPAVLDTTLREGEQTPGVYFDIHIKLAIADLLDAIGVAVIEAGHPAVTGEIAAAVRAVAGRGLQALVGAHARSLASDVDQALACGVQFLGIFYCVSDERLRDRACGLNQAVDQIAAVIGQARSRQPGLTIRYTPEDTVRSPFANVLCAAREAVRAGADIISIADTTGSLIPGREPSLYTLVSRLRDDLARAGLHPRIALHCHNDRGLALANALDGMRAGADVIDAAVLGLGERAGITDLATLLAVMQADYQVATSGDLARLPELYQLVSRFSGVPVPVHFPVVGQNAFTHCAGVHTQAALQNPLHYQSLAPELVGRSAEIALDHMAGMAALQHALERLGIELPPDAARETLRQVKEIGMRGRSVDLAELRYLVRYVNAADSGARIA